MKLKPKPRPWQTKLALVSHLILTDDAEDQYNAVLLVVLHYLGDLARIDLAAEYPATYNWKTKLGKPGLGLKTRLLNSTTVLLNRRVREALAEFGIDASELGVPPSRIGDASTIGGLVFTVCRYFGVAVPKGLTP